MIVGIGTDVCSVDRIAAAQQRHGDRFAQRVLGPDEWRVFDARRARGPMMGMGMSGAAMDPKTMSQMMEMRGEMMKAMGDIMMKHAQRMRAADAPAKK
jgi:hypothetical protein